MPWGKEEAGRPKGSKNKKTLAKEAAMAVEGIAPVKHPKGRPKGSKESKPRTIFLNSLDILSP